MFVVTMRFEVEPDNLALFRAAAIQHAETAREREAACLRYDVSFDPRLPRCLVYAIFVDDVAYDLYIATDYVRVFEELSESWCESRVVDLWELAASPRRPVAMGG